LRDLANSDFIVIMGSNMAEAHPVGFQWMLAAKENGARFAHIDPRFTRTSTHADRHVPLRGGTDIAFLGGVVNYVLSRGLEFREYVAAYTNASFLVREDFADTEDLDGLFSGYDPATGTCDQTTSAYEGARHEPTTPMETGACGPRLDPPPGALPRTRRWPIPAACSRPSPGTTPGTPPRWSSGSAGAARALPRNLPLVDRELRPGPNDGAGLQRRVTCANGLRRTMLLHTLPTPGGKGRGFRQCSPDSYTSSSRLVSASVSTDSTARQVGTGGRPARHPRRSRIAGHLPHPVLGRRQVDPPMHLLLI